MGDTCVIPDCKVRFRDKKKDGKTARSLDSEHNIWLKSLLVNQGLPVESDSKICFKCYGKYVKKRPHSDIFSESQCNSDVQDLQQNEVIDDIPINPPLPLLNIVDLKYASSSHRKCSICLQYNDKCTTIPKPVRHSLLVNNRLWCPPDARICTEHPIRSFLHPDTEVEMTNRESLQAKLDENTGSKVINDLLEIIHDVSKQNDSPKLRLETLSDSDCQAWTGWTLEQFKKMHTLCKPDIISTITANLNSEDLLLFFWAKLKTGLSWPQLSFLTKQSTASLSRYFHKVIGVLNLSLVPKFLGTSHITREEAIAHNTVFTKTFFGDKVSLILDGTYIYLNKSSHHAFQRSSYCGQKKTNYLKFMSVVLPDGYVVDTIGPYYGSVNDASITKLIIDNVDLLRTWLHEHDNVIVDRGFRDVLNVLADLGYDAKMPSFLPAGKSQVDASQANDDRQYTKTRWVVEAYHGRLKKWVLFKDKLPSNVLVPDIGKLVRIATACLNAFRGPIYSADPVREQRDLQMAQRMLSLSNSDNALAKRVADDPSMTRRAKSAWQKLEASQIPFPKMDLEYLETLACGTYQLKLAPGYITEHLTDSGDYEIWVCQHTDDIIRGQIHSRHRSQTKYNVWIQFNLQTLEDPVQAYYCTCPAGKRTSGMCAHVASMMYYLGYYAKHSSLVLANSGRAYYNIITKKAVK